MLTNRFLKKSSKGQTKQIYSTKDIRLATTSFTIGLMMAINVRIPNDKKIQKLVNFGFLAFLIDRTPLPIGETILATTIGLSAFRYQFIKNSMRKDYARDVTEAAIKSLANHDNYNP